jgi:excisionase family DNA binding protein
MRSNLNGETTNSPKTLPVPVAGKAYFGLSRNAAYEAVKRGEIPVIRIGRLLRVPVKALEQMLEQACSNTPKERCP